MSRRLIFSAGPTGATTDFHHSRRQVEPGPDGFIFSYTKLISPKQELNKCSLEVFCNNFRKLNL